MYFGHVAAVFAAAMLCSGCASVINGSTQSIFIATTPVSGAACVASNERGQWPMTSPGSVTIEKSQSVLKILCSKPGWRDGTFYAAGHISTAEMVGALIPYVGILNTAVDASTGAALNYPESYSIEMKPLTPVAAQQP